MFVDERGACVRNWKSKISEFFGHLLTKQEITCRHEGDFDIILLQKMYTLFNLGKPRLFYSRFQDRLETHLNSP